MRSGWTPKADHYHCHSINFLRGSQSLHRIWWFVFHCRSNWKFFTQVYCVVAWNSIVMWNILKCQHNNCCINITEPLFLKYVSTMNEWCTGMFPLCRVTVRLIPAYMSKLLTYFTLKISRVPCPILYYKLAQILEHTYTHTLGKYNSLKDSASSDT